jgi:DNA-binding NarL/FixJ family response regulator
MQAITFSTRRFEPHPPTEISCESSKTVVFTACIIAHSRLATEYLLQPLAQSSNIHAMLLDEFVGGSENPYSTVFIFDGESLTLPLGECLRRLQVRYAGAKYLVVGNVRTAVEVARLLQLGVHGYLDDSKAGHDLMEAAHTVLGGNLWVASDALQQYVMFTSAVNRKRLPQGCALTHREGQILDLVQERYSNREIAQMFCIQESTIKFHLTSIFGKLQVANRRELLDRHRSSDVWESLLLPKGPVVGGTPGVTEMRQPRISKSVSRGRASGQR